ncbi:MAG: hotdog fold thioesterase [Ilumatobacter sp.]|nr:hotdog fold thioesterase [Ilumatobacter sp.]
MQSDAARTMYDRDATAEAFGIELVESSATRAVTRMQVRADMCNGLDVIHGGMTFLLADSAMAFASNAENDAAFATSAEIDWLAPATPGQWLTAVAERRHAGARAAVWDVTVTATAEPADTDGTVVALFRGRTRRVGRPVV